MKITANIIKTDSGSWMLTIGEHDDAIIIEHQQLSDAKVAADQVVSQTFGPGPRVVSKWQRINDDRLWSSNPNPAEFARTYKKA